MANVLMNDPVSEHRKYSDAAFQAERVSGLVNALNALHTLRNRPMPDVSPDVLEQRKMILDIALRITKGELRKALPILINAATVWSEVEI